MIKEANIVFSHGVKLKNHAMTGVNEKQEYASITNNRRDKMKKFRIHVLVQDNTIVSDFGNACLSDCLKRGARWVLCRCQFLKNNIWMQMFPLYYAPSVMEAKKTISKATRGGYITELFVGKRRMASAVYKNGEKTEVLFSDCVAIMSDGYEDIFNNLL